jgi:DNA-binding Lrp family transcriptional regulator
LAPCREANRNPDSFIQIRAFSDVARMQQLDDLDVRIFREFNNPGSPQWNLRESFTAIARRLGVDEETVRLRVGRLRKRGVVPAWRVAVNPRLLGYEETGLDLEVEDASTKPEGSHSAFWLA